MVKKNQTPTLWLRTQAILRTVLGKPDQVIEEIETTEHMPLRGMNSTKIYIHAVNIPSQKNQDTL